MEGNYVTVTLCILTGLFSCKLANIYAIQARVITVIAAERNATVRRISRETS